MMMDSVNLFGIDGFEFVEYIVVDEQGIVSFKYFFIFLGFVEIVKYCFKEVWLYCQGDINFIVNVQFCS